jgi:hypothetical protein
VTVARRTVWLVTGAVAGAASSLYAERKLRRTLEAASARLQPDALVTEVGRSARQAARSTGGRVREAIATGRSTMHRREEELWADLAASGALSTPDGAAEVEPTVPAEGIPVAPTDVPDDSPGSAAAHSARGRGRRRSRRSASHLGK